MKTNMRRIKITKKLVFLALAGAVLLVAGSIAGYRLLKNKDTEPAKTADGQVVNLDPPTTAEKQETDTNKDAIVKKDEATSNQPTSGKKQVDVFIVEASATAVKGYVTGVFEEGGTCTAKATQGTQVVTKSSTGFQNASYTQCTPISWDSTLATGSWLIVLTYDSPTASGTQSKTIEVK